MTSRPRILLFGDSYGTSRNGAENERVSEGETWPQMISERLSDRADVVMDFLPYRMLTDSAADIARHAPCDIVVVMAGIVDCYPRPLPAKLDRSLRNWARILRRLIKPVRTSWLRLIFNKPYATPSEIEAAVDAIEAAFPALVLVPYPPVQPRHAITIPGAQEALFELADRFRSRAGRSAGRVVVADAQVAAILAGYKTFVSDRDSHLTRSGNRLVADLVLAEIEKILTGGCHHGP